MNYSADDELFSIFADRQATTSNPIIKEKLDAIYACLAASGVVYYEEFKELDFDKVVSLLNDNDPQIDSVWAKTLEKMFKVTFKRSSLSDSSSDTPESVVSSSGGGGPLGPPKFVSPGKVPVMLGAFLSSAGRLEEISTVYQKCQFVSVFRKNPQAFNGEYLKPKSDEKLTNICVTLGVLAWGFLNWDKVFCNRVAGVVREHGLLLPKRGSVPAYKRDMAVVLRDKVNSMRNRATLTMKEIKVAPEDITPAVQALIDKGFKVVADPSMLPTFDPATIKKKQMELDDLEDEFRKSIEGEEVKKEKFQLVVEKFSPLLKGELNSTISGTSLEQWLAGNKEDESDDDADIDADMVEAEAPAKVTKKQAAKKPAAAKKSKGNKAPAKVTKKPTAKKPTAAKDSSEEDSSEEEEEDSSEEEEDSSDDDVAEPPAKVPKQMAAEEPKKSTAVESGEEVSLTDADPEDKEDTEDSEMVIALHALHRMPCIASHASYRMPCIASHRTSRIACLASHRISYRMPRIACLASHESPTHPARYRDSSL
jgi:hypothetical protein